jgi:AraC family transcriptional regulator
MIYSYHGGRANLDIKQLVYEITLYIHDNYSEPISVIDISDQALLSPSYFSTVFRVFTGYTVKNYVNRYRLYRAAMDLVKTNKHIIQIAFESGFLSQQSFTKSFSSTYGISPAQFRLLKPSFEPFPPENLWKESLPSMELMDCFKNVRFIKKEAFFVVGVEVDINYNNKNGTSGIGGLWDLWTKEKLLEMIPDKSNESTYGITHSETVDGKAKYGVYAEVSSLAKLPTGMIGRKFDASEFAVFDTTLEIIWTGQFWKMFYVKWLPESGCKLPDEQLPREFATFYKYPAIEVYNKDHKDEKSLLQIFPPVLRK